MGQHTSRLILLPRLRILAKIWMILVRFFRKIKKKDFSRKRKKNYIHQNPIRCLANRQSRLKDVIWPHTHSQQQQQPYSQQQKPNNNNTPILTTTTQTYPQQQSHSDNNIPMLATAKPFSQQQHPLFPLYSLLQKQPHCDTHNLV